uniref:(northern house mosquito) hypothetical protein n=1 Tax=Culex pipiens TaxID=7175 RepID=A0A8D8B2N8_CULPI
MYSSWASSWSLRLPAPFRSAHSSSLSFRLTFSSFFCTSAGSGVSECVSRPGEFEPMALLREAIISWNALTVLFSLLLPSLGGSLAGRSSGGSAGTSFDLRGDVWRLDSEPSSSAGVSPFSRCSSFRFRLLHR